MATIASAQSYSQAGRQLRSQCNASHVLRPTTGRTWLRPTTRRRHVSANRISHAGAACTRHRGGAYPAQGGMYPSQGCMYPPQGMYASLPNGQMYGGGYAGSYAGTGNPPGMMQQGMPNQPDQSQQMQQMQQAQQAPAQQKIKTHRNPCPAPNTTVRRAQLRRPIRRR